MIISLDFFIIYFNIMSLSSSLQTQDEVIKEGVFVSKREISSLSGLNLPRNKCLVNSQSFCPQTLNLSEESTECPLSNCIVRMQENVVIIL